jgi:CheY-like chemotaxis protein
MLMPRCDGPTFVRQMRADRHFARVKLYAVSGTNPESLGLETGPDGIDRWFCKPVDPERLVQILNEELRLSAAV